MKKVCRVILGVLLVINGLAPLSVNAHELYNPHEKHTSERSRYKWHESGGYSNQGFSCSIVDDIGDYYAYNHISREYLSYVAETQNRLSYGQCAIIINNDYPDAVLAVDTKGIRWATREEIQYFHDNRYSATWNGGCAFLYKR